MKIPKSRYEIIQEYGDLFIWTLALGYIPIEGSCRSPFTKDNNPSCSFYTSKNGILRFKDFRTGDNIGPTEGYELATDRHFRTIPEYADQIPDVKITKIESESRKKKKNKKKVKAKIEKSKAYWSATRLHYWSKYHIDEDLLREEVTPLKAVTIHKGSKVYDLKVDYHCYSYYFPNTDHDKIYQPYSKTHKFLGNTSNNDVYGYTTMEGHDLVIITSSGKDYLVLKSLVYRLDLQIDVLAPNGEGYVIPEYYRNKFADKAVLLYYDNDAPGLKSADKHKVIYNNCSSIHNPFDKPKDPSDWISEDKEAFEEFFIDQINLIL